MVPRQDCVASFTIPAVATTTHELSATAVDRTVASRHPAKHAPLQKGTRRITVGAVGLTSVSPGLACARLATNWNTDLDYVPKAAGGFRMVTGVYSRASSQLNCLDSAAHPIRLIGAGGKSCNSNLEVWRIRLRCFAAKDEFVGFQLWSLYQCEHALSHEMLSAASGVSSPISRNRVCTRKVVNEYVSRLRPYRTEHISAGALTKDKTPDANKTHPSVSA